MSYKPEKIFMAEAIRQSELAVKSGNYPYGAVLVHENEIVMRAFNTVLTEGDITAHAELNLIRQASKTLSAQIILNSVLYTSTESCAMCAGAVYWSGIPTVVYGCATEVDAAISEEPFAVRNSEIFCRVGHPIQLVGPFLQSEALEVLTPFWRTYLERLPE